MTSRDPIRTRWADEAPARAEGEAQAGALIRKLAEPSPSTDARFSRIRARVFAELSEGKARRVPLTVLRYAFVAIVLVSAVAAAAVVVQRKVHRGSGWDVLHPFRSAPPPTAPLPPSQSAPTSGLNPSMSASAAELDPEPPITPDMLPTLAKPARPATNPAAEDRAPKEPAAPPETALSEESRTLGDALQKLRQDRDGPGALRALDAYDQKFPSGSLKQEAELARIDALLLAGRRTEALGLLDKKFLDSLPRRVELRITRAELRAEAGRFAEARRDFDAAIPSARGDLFERGLYGRGVCRAKEGDATGARADFDAYLAQFPNGRFASRARDALGSH